MPQLGFRNVTQNAENVRQNNRISLRIDTNDTTWQDENCSINEQISLTTTQLETNSVSSRDMTT